MSEHTICVRIESLQATLELICDTINYPDLIHDILYAKFQRKVPDWSEHGWDLRAVTGENEIIVTARRKA
jgi:hypothetical protein